MGNERGPFPTAEEAATFGAWIATTRSRRSFVTGGASGLVEREGRGQSTTYEYLVYASHYVWPELWPTVHRAWTRGEQRAYWHHVDSQTMALFDQGGAEELAGLDVEGEGDEEADAVVEAMRDATAAVITRDHCYQTELYLLQDAGLSEPLCVNLGMTLLALWSLNISTACRPGMVLKKSGNRKNFTRAFAREDIFSVRARRGADTGLTDRILAPRRYCDSEYRLIRVPKVQRCNHPRSCPITRPSPPLSSIPSLIKVNSTRPARGARAARSLGRRSRPATRRGAARATRARARPAGAARRAQAGSGCARPAS